jgi:heme A synthase
VPAPRDVHRAATGVLSVAMLVLGLVMVALTLARGGGIVSLGVVLGVLFVAAGAGRLRLMRGPGA